MRVNDVKFVDGKDDISIVFERRTMRFPKDFCSDAFRLAEAVEEKCPLLRGMVPLPNIKGDTVLGAPSMNWKFKEMWDKGSAMKTKHVWGGDFQTYAVDHTDGESFAELNIEGEHYFNVCISIREVSAFMTKNPGFSARKCNKDCLGVPHVHAVHGYYKGAVVGHGDTLWECAPPLRLHSGWRDLSLNPRLMPAKKKALAKAKKEPGTVPKGAAIAAMKRGGGLPEGGDRTMWEGATTLENFIKDPASTWTQVLVSFSDPSSVVWAPHQDAIKSGKFPKHSKMANYMFVNKVVPLLREEGSPLKTVLDTIWKLDVGKDRLLTCLLIRKLIEMGYEIFSFKNNQIEWVKMSD